MKISENQNRIPVSVTLDEITSKSGAYRFISEDKKRILYISVLAVAIAAGISFIGKGLVLLINLCTNISFYGNISLEHNSPAGNEYGLWVIIVPAIGGLIVGLMALYGSKAIRGHGIPEAMEQILVNDSKIKPSITFLKPLSSAISIGTGGPFGSEGPIIATGGALGSTIGQVLRISSVERKILLASGATAGMSAIFGSPIAAIFLAIELLLFEFSPRSIIPVALACITGSAGHHLLFETGPIFPMPHIDVPGNGALAVYSVVGLILGLVSAFVTKIVYFIEDSFEKLPVHWSLWPALGGLVVGLVGYFAPETLGVGYENITGILSGNLALQVVVSLCVLKFISWSVALGSGTSGGTLAPLLTIGSATGALLGFAAINIVPDAGVTIPLAALVGMSAMFAGSSRALLTSIIFAIETTEQSNALLPLLAACVASYIVSFFLLKNTIMTEKIARRGVAAPDEYEPDVLGKIRIAQVLRGGGIVITENTTVDEARQFLNERKGKQHNHYIISSEDGEFRGIISITQLIRGTHSGDTAIGQLIKRKPAALNDRDTLRSAVEMMASENIDEIPIVSANDNRLVGVLSHKEIMSAYLHRADQHTETLAISLKRRTFRMMIHGRKKLVRRAG